MAFSFTLGCSFLAVAERVLIHGPISLDGTHLTVKRWTGTAGAGREATVVEEYQPCTDTIKVSNVR